MAAGSYQAGGWEEKRRVIYEAEAMPEGTDTRFVVTDKAAEPKKLYDVYVKRGEIENHIKDFELHLEADRLGCQRFLLANQFSGCRCTRRRPIGSWTC